MKKRVAAGVCAIFAGHLAAAAPVLALSCGGLPPFLEIVRRDRQAIVVHVKIFEQSVIERGNASRKMRVPVAIGEVAKSYRGGFDKRRVTIGGSINADSGIDGLRPGSEWVVIGHTNPRLPEIDLWPRGCSGNALAVKGSFAEGFVRRWRGHNGTSYHGWSWKPEYIHLDQLQYELRIR